MTADTSVLVPALTSWHEGHAAAASAMARVRVLLAHTILETYSVLTRLPAGQRLDATLVARMLAHGGRPAPLTLPGTALARLPARLAADGITGGAAYDALVGATAAHHGLVLLTRDRRAAASYDAVGAAYELVG